MSTSYTRCIDCEARFEDGVFVEPHLTTCRYYQIDGRGQFQPLGVERDVPAQSKKPSNKDKKSEFLSRWQGPGPTAEYHFMRDGILGHPPGIRKRAKLLDVKDWRFDFAWPDVKVAVEVDGNAWHVKGGGGHMKDDDLRKLNYAKIMGWIVFRFSPNMLKHRTQECLNLVTRAINLRKEGDL